MNWWPEAFPRRAAFAAVRLATRDYFPGKHGVLSASNPHQPKGLPGSSAARQLALKNSEQEVSKVVIYLTLSRMPVNPLPDPLFQPPPSSHSSHLPPSLPTRVGNVVPYNNPEANPRSTITNSQRGRCMPTMRRECLVLDEGLVKECYKQDEDADSFKGTVQGSRAQHSMYFPATTEGELMWSMTACACSARMSNPPQPCGAQCRGSMPLEPMPMLLDKEAARQAALNAECIRLMVLDTPGMPQFDTLNKDLLKAWCKHNNIRGVSK
ncbi:hypothetical protein HaLaN_24935 [Haematococcus lacustris]|uniref:Uncharacterized protein n=1 Tax=Haematococcus lacustris TaxID=44745 RepID=A0A6A0A203_HAELA|nr:hypothetical protein HaLaN_24935 [Haematococcus lacustris]